MSPLSPRLLSHHLCTEKLSFRHQSRAIVLSRRQAKDAIGGGVRTSHVSTPGRLEQLQLKCVASIPCE